MVERLAAPRAMLSWPCAREPARPRPTPDPTACRAQAMVDQDLLERAASALRQDAVYVDPDAERAISPGAADQLEAAVGGGETPIFIAILPASVAAEANNGPSLRRGMGSSAHRRRAPALVHSALVQTSVTTDRPWVRSITRSSTAPRAATVTGLVMYRPGHLQAPGRVDGGGRSG